jgi:possible phosphatase
LVEIICHLLYNYTVIKTKEIRGEKMKEDWKELIKKNLKWVVLFICLVGFLALAEDVFNKEIMYGDIIGYKLISTFLISDFVTPIAKFITNFGGAIFLSIATVMLFLLIKNKKIGLSIISNIVIITVLNQLLKRILQRPRPTEFRIVEEKGYSFPSGHSMVSMAFYGYLIYLIYRYIKNKYVKWTLITILSILICLIGISRIYLGVHYTSDVLGGFLLSISYLVIYISSIKKLLPEE